MTSITILHTLGSLLACKQINQRGDSIQPYLGLLLCLVVNYSLAGTIQSDSLLSPEHVFERNSPSIIKIVATDNIFETEEVAQGSAIIIENEIVVTNCHVIENKPFVFTKINDKLKFLILKKSNDDLDLCLLYISLDPAEKIFTPINKYRSHSSLKVGERVYAIGSPRGLENTFSEGLISGLRGSGDIKLIQSTTPVTHGSSGGALFDGKGNLIGVTTLALKEGNFAFSVPIDFVLSMVSELKNEATDREKPAPPPKFPDYPLVDNSRHFGDSDSTATTDPADKNMRSSVAAGRGRLNLPVDSSILQTHAARAWIDHMSSVLVKDGYLFLTDTLGAIFYESSRAGLDPDMVLAMVDQLSGFDSDKVSSAGRVGLLQVNVKWVEKIGNPDDDLTNANINLRYGCTIFRHYIDLKDGDVYAALALYFGDESGSDFPHRVLAIWKDKYQYPVVTINSFSLGKEVGEDKKVTAPSDTFGPKDTIYASVETSGSGKASLKAVWTYRMGDHVTLVNETPQEVDASGPATTEFHISKPDGWPVGKYKVEIFLNDTLVGSKDYEVRK